MLYKVLTIQSGKSHQNEVVSPLSRKAFLENLLALTWATGAAMKPWNSAQATYFPALQAHTQHIMGCALPTPPGWKSDMAISICNVVTAI